MMAKSLEKTQTMTIEAFDSGSHILIVLSIQIIHTPIKGGLQIVEVAMTFSPKSGFGAK